ncbi:hypothetical protein NLI96_g437 [Meripilus lineatus]|uniref:Endonuclease/exonuclease/phosphatase domain-containing protein n=1 Tax=Meripilus lineatus TaxID=2056292 RepID=A0AAD5VC55_9APHY|nr:hypothetical protein NLI96_g437 [Physisporinus lineatus]
MAEFRGNDRLIEVEHKYWSPNWKKWRQPSSSFITKKPPSSIRIVTWNIDFASPDVRPRLAAAISHIQTEVVPTIDGAPEPCCILLQEVSYQVFRDLLAHPWVRKYFQVVPTTTREWPAGNYGVVTLVSKTITVSKVQSLIFANSVMGRNALMVDLKLATPESENQRRPEIVTVRVANVHLESLPMGQPARPQQLAAIAEMLKEEGIHAGLVGGDMNMIGPNDARIHIDAGLVDSWIWDDSDEEGNTWGYQPSCQYPAGRLDRVFFTSAEDVEVQPPTRIGIDVKTEDGVWASDHYGLVTMVDVLI